VPAAGRDRAASPTGMMEIFPVGPALHLGGAGVNVIDVNVMDL
jgi:hypothetical protein